MAAVAFIATLLRGPQVFGRVGNRCRGRWNHKINIKSKTFQTNKIRELKLQEKQIVIENNNLCKIKIMNIT